MRRIIGGRGTDVAGHAFGASFEIAARRDREYGKVGALALRIVGVIVGEQRGQHIDQDAKRRAAIAEGSAERLDGPAWRGVEHRRVRRLLPPSVAKRSGGRGEAAIAEVLASYHPLLQAELEAWDQAPESEGECVSIVEARLRHEFAQLPNYAYRQMAERLGCRLQRERGESCDLDVIAAALREVQDQRARATRW